MIETPVYGIFWTHKRRLDRYRASSPLAAVRCFWDKWCGEVNEIRRSMDTTWFTLHHPNGAVAYTVYVRELDGDMAGPARTVPGYATLGVTTPSDTGESR